MGRGRKRRGKNKNAANRQNQARPNPSAPPSAAAAGQGGGRPAAVSLAQKRAAHALACVEALKEGGEYGNYVSYVKAIPAAIIMSGLGQALAIEKAGARKDKGHERLYAHLNAWLCNAGGSGWRNTPFTEANGILEAITSHSEDAYIRAQMEAMEYLEWLKKFAVAFLKDTEGAE